VGTVLSIYIAPSQLGPIDIYPDLYRCLRDPVELLCISFPCTVHVSK
jgi:hypothetical protein